MILLYIHWYFDSRIQEIQLLRPNYIRILFRSATQLSAHLAKKTGIRKKEEFTLA